MCRYRISTNHVVYRHKTVRVFIISKYFSSKRVDRVNHSRSYTVPSANYFESKKKNNQIQNVENF